MTTIKVISKKLSKKTGINEIASFTAVSGLLDFISSEISKGKTAEFRNFLVMRPTQHFKPRINPATREILSGEKLVRRVCLTNPPAVLSRLEKLLKEYKESDPNQSTGRRS